jgi:hypothetical protein
MLNYCTSLFFYTLNFLKADSLIVTVFGFDNKNHFHNLLVAEFRHEPHFYLLVMCPDI